MCDGFTETSGTETDPSGPPAGSGATRADEGQQAQDQPSLVDGQSDEAEMNPQTRSLSMDSAYGTLSPQSELELHGQSPMQEEEEEEVDRGGQEEQTALGEGGEPEEEEQQEVKRREQGKEDGRTASGDLTATVHAAPAQKPRRRPPVQLRVQALQALHNKSRSEDNLLQRLHSDLSAKTVLRSDPGGSAAEHLGGARQRRESKASGRVSHSRSLSELGRRRNGDTLSNHTGENTPPDAKEDRLTQSLPAGKLSSAFKTAQDLQHSGEADCPSTQTEETALSGGQEEEHTKDTGSGEEACNKKSPGQQHKKLTLAQLYRIRTTMVLNSTLTAS